MIKHVAVVCVEICCIVATPTAFGLMAPIGSLNKFPLSWTAYPESARQQIESALKAENCKFVGGHWINGRTNLKFGGDTDALNEMLKRLANCPGVCLTVSFEESDRPVDWRVEFAAHARQVHAIVKLRSKNIALDRLVIPAATGPQLAPSTSAPAKQ